MKKICYTNAENYLSIVYPAPKHHLEKVLGVLTDREYEDFVFKRSIEDQGISDYRFIDDGDIPKDSSFRDAWEDSQEGDQIDINCEKARDIKLEEMRKKRIDLLAEQDKLYMIAVEKGLDTSVITAEKERLRNITEPLKALDVKGKYNDNILLNTISSYQIEKTLLAKKGLDNITIELDTIDRLIPTSSLEATAA